MYNFLDYDNDRKQIRDKFLNEMHKKTTLKDIGETLDKLILDEKAATAQYVNPYEDTKIKYASKDSDSLDHLWSGKLFKNT